MISLVAAAALMLSLSACGENDDGSSAESNAQGGVQSSDNASVTPADTESQNETMEYRRPLDLDAVYSAVLAEQPEGMEPLAMQAEDDREVIYSVYPTLENVDVNQMVYYRTSEEDYPCELIMIEAQSQRGADYAYDVFLERIERAAQTASAENADGWINLAEVHQEGVYVAMIVLPDGYEIPYNVFSLVD